MTKAEGKDRGQAHKSTNREGYEQKRHKTILEASETALCNAATIMGASECNFGGRRRHPSGASETAIVWDKTQGSARVFFVL